jgi:hypothetical protein
MVKKIFSFALHQEAVDLIDEYRRRCLKIPSRSDALEQLIKKGAKSDV